MQRGTTERVSLVVEGAPLLGFLDILGLAPRSLFNVRFHNNLQFQLYFKIKGFAMRNKNIFIRSKEVFFAGGFQAFFI